MPKRRVTRSTSLIAIAVVALLGLALSFAPRSVVEIFPPEIQQVTDTARDVRQQLAGRLQQDSQQSPASGQAKPPGTLPDTPGSFSTAKRILYEDIHHDRRISERRLVEETRTPR